MPRSIVHAPCATEMPAEEYDSDDSIDEEQEDGACCAVDSSRTTDSQLLVPFVPLHKALREIVCNPARMSVVLAIAVLTVLGMTLLPAEKFVATYKGGSNKGISEALLRRGRYRTSQDFPPCAFQVLFC